MTIRHDDEVVDIAEPRRSEISESHLISRAIAKLVTGLGQAKDFLDAGEPRIAAMKALQAVIIHVDSVPGSQEAGLVRPLEILWQALDDAERGCTHSLLIRTVSKGQPTPDRKRRLQLWTAAFVEARRLRGEEKLEDAARYVARQLIAAGIQIPGEQKAPLWKTILRWRQNFEGRERDAAVRRRYRRLVQKMRTRPGDLRTLFKGFITDRRHLL